MLSIRDDVFNTMEDRDLSLETAASILEIHVNSLYNFKKSGSIGFRSLLKLAQLLYGKDYHDKMREWCLLLPSTEAIKHAFEYAAIKRDTDLLKNLLESAEGDNYLDAYSGVYGVILDYMNDDIDFNDLFPSLHAIKLGKDKDLKILVNIFKCYQLYFEKDFTTISSESIKIFECIESLNNDRKHFFRECYLYRLSEIMMPVNLYFSHYEETRKFCKVIINSKISSKTMSDAYYYIGMSYLLDDKDKCLKNLAISLKLMETVGEARLVKEAENNLALAETYFTIREEGVLKDVSELVNSMRLKESSDFARYFSFRLKNDLESIYEGFSHFIESANFLFAGLIVEDLAAFGVDQRQIKALKSINYIKKGEIDFEKNYANSFSYWSCIDGVGA